MAHWLTLCPNSIYWMVDYLISSESCYPNQEFGTVCAMGTQNPLAYQY